MNYDTLCTHCMRESGVDPGQPCPHCGHIRGGDPPVQHQLKPMTILKGRYMVGDVLGEGGFGITYIGLDMQLEMRVAIKEFYPNGYASRESQTTTLLTIYSGQSEKVVLKWREKFLDEAKTLAKVSNLSGVVGVREYFKENNTAYIVMDYLEGQTLKAYAASMGGRIPANELLPALEPVVTALARIHDQGLIHRDISPDNIMRSPDGSLQILDFGAARDYTSQGEKSLSVMLKPGFAPEEQYRSRGVQGPWSDVYALCGTIYKCLTGETPPESMERLRNDALAPPSSFGVHLSPAQEEVIMKGLAVYKENRIQNMNELHTGLYGNQVQGLDSSSYSRNWNQPAQNGPVTGSPTGYPGRMPDQTVPFTQNPTGYPGGMPDQTMPFAQNPAGYPGGMPDQTMPFTQAPMGPGGQTAWQGNPGMTQGMPGGNPAAGMEGAYPPPQPKKSHLGLIIGICVGVMVLIGGIGVFVYIQSRNALNAIGNMVAGEEVSDSDEAEFEWEYDFGEETDNGSQDEPVIPDIVTGGSDVTDSGSGDNEPAGDGELPEDNSDILRYEYSEKGAREFYASFLEYLREEYPEGEASLAMAYIDYDNIPEGVIKVVETDGSEYLFIMGLKPNGEIVDIDEIGGKKTAFCYSAQSGQYLLNAYGFDEDNILNEDRYRFGSFSEGEAQISDVYEASWEEYDGRYPHMSCVLNGMRVGQFHWISDMRSKYSNTEFYSCVEDYQMDADSAFQQASSHNGESGDVMVFLHYMLPYSNNCYLAWEDLDDGVVGLNQQEERLARNELYARNGMHFQDDALNQHFYGGTNGGIFTDNGYNENQARAEFNDVENTNLELIQSYKNVMGY